MGTLQSLAWCCGWWLFACVAMAQSRVSDIPSPRETPGGWISDSTNQLGQAGPELERLLGALNRDTKAEVAVAIVPSIGDETPKDFAVALFKHWSIGRRAQDDGLLVLHVLDQRRIEIETGYGLESVLTDMECAWLINDVTLPLFRAGKLREGHSALLHGIDYGIRHPDAKREQLLAAANADNTQAAAPVTKATASAKAGPSFDQFSEDVGPALMLVMMLAGFSGLLRKLAHRRQYRDPKRRPDEFSGCLVSLFSLLAGVLLVAGWMTELGWVAWCGVACLGIFAGFSLRGSFYAFREGARRYAPRACTCNAKMSIVPDDQDERYLDEGQRTEERVRAADYSVWRCACGAVSIERYADEGDYSECQSCGYQTLKLETKEVKAATHIESGLGERHYSCAHCNAQRVEPFTIPQITSGSSGARSSRKRSGGSSHSSGSPGSFGGGRSGGGGAGGGY